MGPFGDFDVRIVDERLAPDRKRNHHSIVGRLGCEFVKKRLVVRRSFIIEAMPIAKNETIQEHQTLEALGNRFRDFGDNGATEAVSDENKVREIFGNDVIDDRLRAVRVIYALVDALTVARDGGRESLMTSVCQLENRGIPSRAVMPGTVHQYERFQSWFS